MLRKLSLIVALFLTGCASNEVSHFHHQQKPIVARITYYGGKHERVAMPGVKRAVEGTTVAAHPNYCFGTIIFIPDLQGKVGNGYFQVLDRGTDVTRRKASHGQADVFDVYVTRPVKISKLAKTMPEYMEVFVQ